MTKEEAVKELKHYTKFYKDIDATLVELSDRFEDILTLVYKEYDETITNLNSQIEYLQSELDTIKSSYRYQTKGD